MGTGVGGVVGPYFLSHLIDTGSRQSVFIGYLIGSALMILAAGSLISKPLLLNANRSNKSRGLYRLPPNEGRHLISAHTLCYVRSARWGRLSALRETSMCSRH